MVIKLQRGTSINMTAIDKVAIIPQEKVTFVGGGLFTKPDKKVERTWDCKICYRNFDGKDATFTITNFQSPADALKCHDNVLSQIKELEMERLSTDLENAIRNSGESGT